MFQQTRFLRALSLSAVMGLAACSQQSETAAPQPQATPQSVKADRNVTAAPTASPKPDYDFERQLRLCAGAICELLLPEKMKVTDFNSDIISDLRLSKDDTLAAVREKFSLFYSGMISSGLTDTTDANLKVFHAQLIPANRPELNEYEVFVRFDGMSNTSKLHDWGARIRCAPVTDSTPWHVTACE